MSSILYKTLFYCLQPNTTNHVICIRGQQEDSICYYIDPPFYMYTIIVFLNILYQCLDYSHWKYLTSDQLAHDMVEDKKKHRNVIQRCVFGIQDPKNKSSDEITYDFVYLELHLLGLLRTISWYGSYKLMVYTYRKGLSEQFYS